MTALPSRSQSRWVLSGTLTAAMAIAAARTRRGWGSTCTERTRSLPGDDLEDAHAQSVTHAVTIDASRERVWPWIAQMGYGRGGWYTPAWVDTVLWKVSNPSADDVIPELQEIASGDVILDGPPGTAVFEVVDVQPGHWLVLHSRRHPVRGVPPDLTSTSPGPYLSFSWVFWLAPTDANHTRVLLRTRGRPHLGRMNVVARAVFPSVDYVMSRWLLKGLQRRVEQA